MLVRHSGDHCLHLLLLIVQAATLNFSVYCGQLVVCSDTVSLLLSLSGKGKQKGWPSVSTVTYVIIKIGAGDVRSFFFLLLLVPGI